LYSIGDFLNFLISIPDRFLKINLTLIFLFS
jgi:hypothetical protein